MAAKILQKATSAILQRASFASLSGSTCAANYQKQASWLLSRWQSSVSNPNTKSAPMDQATREKANYEARVELALAYRAVHHYDLGEGICNHLTMRAPGRTTDDDVMLVVPYGLPWQKVTASSLIGLDFKTGEKVEGEGVVLESAVCIHIPIHEARYDKHGTIAVMHTHQPYVTALACLDEPAPFDETMCQNSMRFSGRIAYDFDYEVLAYEMEEGDRLAGALGDRDILIMGQHGLLTAGKRVCDAFDALYYMERAAQVQVLVRSTGAKSRSSPPHVVKEIASHDCYPYNAITHFESMYKLLEDEKPNFRE
ncbi:putative aldolase class 2 protein PA3430 isoform X1 [Lytechinus pictus]|uniref:putative aldolase class 2 protein PA3430 isoform X1 n=1 Tax=Lytechinus pictus TaxID=7653 RepID=UPI00240D3678|nr:putative aldolase class 2 protein PA3430 [Lytechinus pictus]